MSTVTITVFSAVILILVLNTILEHLFNWWFREWNTADIVVLPIVAYLIKTGILILLFFNLLH